MALCMIRFFSGIPFSFAYWWLNPWRFFMATNMVTTPITKIIAFYWHRLWGNYHGSPNEGGVPRRGEFGNFVYEYVDSIY